MRFLVEFKHRDRRPPIRSRGTGAARPRPLGQDGMRTRSRERAMNPILRPCLMLGLACLVPAAVGCHSLGVWPASKPDTQNENTAAQAGTTTSAVPAMKTDLAPG